MASSSVIQQWSCRLAFALAILVCLTASLLAQERGVRANSQQLFQDDWGNYWAFIIGINQYKEWPRLRTAARDAIELKNVLQSKYGFREDQIILRTEQDATLSRLTKDLRSIAEALTENDRWLIYFAGHGQIDPLTSEGYWIPADGKLKDPSTWLAHSTVKLILGSDNVRAQSICLVADSCYAGTLLRGGPGLLNLEDRAYVAKLRRLSALRSRQVFTSGGVEPVADGGRDGHSLFAYYFLKALRENGHKVIDLENLFHTRVWGPVAEISGQTPGLGRLKSPMDEDGQFVLVNYGISQLENEVSALIEEDRSVNTESRGVLSRAELEQSAYEGIRESQDIQQWKKFLELFPGGAYTELARQKIRNLEVADSLNDQQELLRQQQIEAEKVRLEQEARELDERAFATAQKLSTAESYQRYLDQFPSGAYTAEARDQLKSLEKEALAEAQEQTQASVDSGNLQKMGETEAWLLVTQTTEESEKVKLAENFLENFPKSEMKPVAHTIVAVGALTKNQEDKFIFHAEQTLEDHPDNLLVLVPLASGYAENGRAEDAIRTANHGLKLLNALTAPPQMKEEEWLQQKNGYSADLHYALGRAYLEKGVQEGASGRSNLERATQELNQTVDLDPAHDYGWFRLAFAYFRLGRNQDAVLCYARAASLNAGSSAYARRELETLYVNSGGKKEDLPGLIQEQGRFIELKLAGEEPETNSSSPPSLLRPGEEPR